MNLVGSTKNTKIFKTKVKKSHIWSQNIHVSSKHSFPYKDQDEIKIEYQNSKDNLSTLSMFAESWYLFICNSFASLHILVYLGRSQRKESTHV